MSNHQDLLASAIGADEACSLVWDLVVVGAGVGGSTIGAAAAQAGLSVLYIERGQIARPVTGEFAEQDAPFALPRREKLMSTGREDRSILDETGLRAKYFVPFVGAGPGGSSALFGMAMERFQPGDFEGWSTRGLDSGSVVSGKWPIGYDDLTPYYDRAEQLFRVCGERDPLHRASACAQTPGLSRSRPLKPLQHWIGDHLRRSGLHPYRLPMAGGQSSGCSTCQGYLCASDCKVDAWSACGLPATRLHGARLLAGTAVARLNVRRGEPVEVECLDTVYSIQAKVRARQVALAAGAIRTPLLLLASANADHPSGLGNANGWVGRGLMRHAIDLYAVKGPADLLQADPSAVADKSWGFNDFYERSGLRLGSVQSFGRLPPAEVLFQTLRQDLRESVYASPLAALIPMLRPLLQPTLDQIALGSVILASTLQDRPDAANRIRPGRSPGDSARLRYKLAAADRPRLERLRMEVSRSLKGLPVRLLRQADNNQRIAHVCGTCRMGKDATVSVTDALGRVRGAEQVLVADASLFPSSGGTNPSLTIAANALRIAAMSFGLPRATLAAIEPDACRPSGPRADDEVSTNGLDLPCLSE